MASKSDRIYYENFNAAAELICSAANYLVDCLSSYKPEEINHMLEKMHGFEHDADGKKHEMSSCPCQGVRDTAGPRGPCGA